MDAESPDALELARLTREYQQAIDDLGQEDVGEVTRVARTLELQARYLGQIEACRERIEARLKR